MLKDRLEVPVPIRWKGSPRNVCEVAEAARLLVDPGWPVRGRRHGLACKALVEWSERPTEHRLREVQSAFRDAAAEAGILIGASIH